MALDPTLFAEFHDAGLLPVDVEAASADVEAVFLAADAAGVATVVLTSDDIAALAEIGADDRALARMAAALAGGKVLVTPSKTVDVGGVATIAWWVYDPVTGALFDQMADGRGGATVVVGPMGEAYATRLWAFTKTARGILALGACLAAVARAAAAMIQQRGGAPRAPCSTARAMSSVPSSPVAPTWPADSPRRPWRQPARAAPAADVPWPTPVEPLLRRRLP